MAYSLVPSDRREGLIQEASITNQKLADFENGHHLQRENNSIGNYDRNYLRGKIAAHAKLLGYELPAAGWYIEDTIPNTNVFMIKSIPRISVKNIGYIPFFENDMPSERWNGLIIDLDDENFVLKPPPIYTYKKMIAKGPIMESEDSFIVDGFDVYEGGEFEDKIEFFRHNKIISYTEGPVLRIWKYNERVYCSTMSRIDGWESPLIQDKNNSVAYFWTKLTDITPDNLLENTFNLCFHIQLNAPELLPFTRMQYSLPVLLGIIATNSEISENPIINLPISSILNLPMANNWLGYNVNSDVRLTDGNAVIITDEETKEATIVMSHAYAWRADLIREINFQTPWLKRYLEICDSRMLSPEVYVSIYPQVVPNIDTASGRLENATKIWELISPPYLREDASKLLEEYWGNEGKIYQLSEIMTKAWKDPEAVNLRKNIYGNNAYYIMNTANDFKKEFKHLPDNKIYTKLLFNSSPTKPHFEGGFIYTLLRRMKKYNQMKDYIEKKKMQV